MEPLLEIPTLREISAYECPIKGIEPQGPLESLEILDLSRTHVHDLGFIRFCKNLQELAVQGTAVRDIEDIGQCKQLSRIWLQKTRICNISVLENLTHLEIIDISYTDVQTLEPILHNSFFGHGGLLYAIGLKDEARHEPVLTQLRKRGVEVVTQEPTL